VTVTRWPFFGGTRPGKHTKSDRKWQFLVDFPSYKMVIFQSYVAVYQRVPSLTNQPCKGGVGISRHSEMGGFAPLSAQCLLVHHAELKHAQVFLSVLHSKPNKLRNCT
jgi:hypothetical protein